MIASGIVIHIGERAHTLIRHSRCRVEVKWYKNVLPPRVKIGAKVAVLGKVMTFSNGRSFQLIDTVLLTRQPREIMVALTKLIDGLVVDPKSFLKDNELHRQDMALPQPKVPT